MVSACQPFITLIPSTYPLIPSCLFLILPPFIRSLFPVTPSHNCRLPFAFTPARERMIGWYHTGPKLRASDQEINDLFKKFIAKPVMVIVDVRPNTVGIPTDAYFAVEEIKDVRCFSWF
jgi:hypothetical protein